MRESVPCEDEFFYCSNMIKYLLSLTPSVLSSGMFDSAI